MPAHPVTQNDQTNQFLKRDYRKRLCRQLNTDQVRHIMANCHAMQRTNVVLHTLVSCVSLMLTTILCSVWSLNGTNVIRGTVIRSDPLTTFAILRQMIPGRSKEPATFMVMEVQTKSNVICVHPMSLIQSTIITLSKAPTVNASYFHISNSFNVPWPM